MPQRYTEVSVYDKNVGGWGTSGKKIIRMGDCVRAMSNAFLLCMAGKRDNKPLEEFD